MFVYVVLKYSWFTNMDQNLDWKELVPILFSEIVILGNAKKKKKKRKKCPHLSEVPADVGVK